MIDWQKKENLTNLRVWPSSGEIKRAKCWWSTCLWLRPQSTSTARASRGARDRRHCDRSNRKATGEQRRRRMKNYKRRRKRRQCGGGFSTSWPLPLPRRSFFLFFLWRISDALTGNDVFTPFVGFSLRSTWHGRSSLPPN